MGAKKYVILYRECFVCINNVVRNDMGYMIGPSLFLYLVGAKRPFWVCLLTRCDGLFDIGICKCFWVPIYTFDPGHGLNTPLYPSPLDIADHSLT